MSSFTEGNNHNTRRERGGGGSPYAEMIKAIPWLGLKANLKRREQVMRERKPCHQSKGGVYTRLPQQKMFEKTRVVNQASRDKKPVCGQSRVHGKVVKEHKRSSARVSVLLLSWECLQSACKGDGGEKGRERRGGGGAAKLAEGRARARVCVTHQQNNASMGTRAVSMPTSEKKQSNKSNKAKRGVTIPNKKDPEERNTMSPAVSTASSKSKHGRELPFTELLLVKARPGWGYIGWIMLLWQFQMRIVLFGLAGTPSPHSRVFGDPR